MTGKPAARGCHHPTYPEYREKFGEDPARFLYHLDPRPRIRGITDPDLLRAYMDVETDRHEPRRTVIAACNQRLEELQGLDVVDAQQAAVAADGGERR